MTTKPRYPLPDFIIIGAAKCGTTSLATYLDGHPGIQMSRPKELRFFTDNWHKGEHWYRSRFSGAPEGSLVGEASPQYTQAPLCPGVPARMASVVSQARLIYMVRDPIDQMKSYFRHRIAEGREQEARFDEAVRINNTYLAVASFGFQLGLFLDEYPAEQILVVDAAQLDTDRRSTIGRILDFLDVDGDVPKTLLEVKHNTAEEKPMIPASLLRPRAIWRRASRVTGKLPRRWRHSVRRALGRPLAEGALNLRSDSAKWLRSRIGPDLEYLSKHTGDTLQPAITTWHEHLDRSVSEGT